MEVKRFLICKVSLGMFSNEYVVGIENDRGESTEIFVIRDLVTTKNGEKPSKGHPVDGRLSVYAEVAEDKARVVLPVSSYNLGQIISVSVDALSPTAEA